MVPALLIVLPPLPSIVRTWPVAMLKELEVASIVKLSIVALMSCVTAEAAGISTLNVVGDPR